MKENVYKKVEYYLYNYKDIDNIIENIRESVIGTKDLYIKKSKSSYKSLYEGI